MQPETKTDTILKYGKAFQNKVIASLLSDSKFVSSIEDILDRNYFDTESSKWIVGTVQDYFRDYGNVPSLDVLSIEYKQLDSSKESLRVDIKNQLQTSYSVIESDDLLYVKENFRQFCKNQKLKKAILKSVDFLQLGEYDSIGKLIQDALNSGIEVDLGTDYVADFDKRVSEEARSAVATPWAEINDLTGGGCASGELFCVIAPSGIGKSWLLCDIGAKCLVDGLNVLHYTLELGESYVGKRYDTIFTKIPTSEHHDRLDEIKNTISGKVNGRLFIKRYPSKTVSVRNLKPHIEKLKLSGFTPDIIIVDYGDLLIPSYRRTDNKYEDGGSIYEELRGLAGELEIPIWTASQTNRDSKLLDVIDTDSVADSFAKVMVSDFVISVSRKQQDKMSNSARFFVAKNRFGPDGILFKGTMNTFLGEINFSDNSSAVTPAPLPGSMANIKKAFNELV